MTGRFAEGRCGRNSMTGKALDQCVERQKLTGVGEPLQQLLSRFLAFTRLDDQDQRVLGQVIGQRPETLPAAADRGQLNFLERFDAPLAGRVEPADRLDLVIKQLDPDRCRLIRREDIEDPAALAELAR